MTIEGFEAACKDPNSEVYRKIADIRKNYELESLYLLHISLKEIAWGFRGLDVDALKLLLELITLIYEQTGMNYNTEMNLSSLFGNSEDEVEFLVDRLARPYVEDHEGKIEVRSLNENSGEILVSMSGTCGNCASLPFTLRLVVEEMLKSRLPWVKKVSLAGGAAVKIVEPSASEKEIGIIIITERAARKIKSIINERNFPTTGGLRLSIISDGRSGFQYRYGVEEKPGKDDEVIVRQFTDNGNQAAGRVFVTKLELQFLVGAKLDYGPASDWRGESFNVNNPNGKSSCS